MSELTLDTAKAVVDAGIKNDAFYWDEGTNTDTASEEVLLSHANGLIEQCTTASKGGSVSPAVLAILHAAGIEPLSDSTREAYVAQYGEPAASNGHAPETEVTVGTTPSTDVGDGAGPASAADIANAAAKVEGQQPEVDISEIFPRYDDLKAAEIAKAILASAADGSLAEDEWLKILDYERLHEQRGPILSLEPEFKQPEPEPVHEPPEVMQGAFTQSAPNTANTMTSGGVSTGFVSDSNSGSGDDVADFYEGGVLSIAQQENLPLPEKVDSSQVPILPLKITEVDDKELSDLSTRFHSHLARTLWLLSQEEGRRDLAEHLEREAERDAYVSEYEKHRSAIPEEKQTQPTALEAARKAAEKEAEVDDTVRNYRSRKVRHSAEARELKALSVIFDKSMFRIKDELERRGLSSRSSASVK
jgi:hypothetical protein